MNQGFTPSSISMHPFAASHAAQVRALFIKVNRLLSPPDMKEAFESYIARSLSEEINRISDYYAERGGGFWVTTAGDAVVGMFGLEPSSDDAMELRRMYVDPDMRRRGIARMMLIRAERETRERGYTQMRLSTSELQSEALALYKNSGYTVVREGTTENTSNKTIGGGIRRYHLKKKL